MKRRPAARGPPPELSLSGRRHGRCEEGCPDPGLQGGAHPRDELRTYLCSDTQRCIFLMTFEKGFRGGEGCGERGGKGCGHCQSCRWCQGATLALRGGGHYLESRV